ncbi:MAG: AMP-binding protein [Solirubrobacteraceae bacterium]|nr:AMP-binding protein [Solirubrobacteraceae bacterium]
MPALLSSVAQSLRVGSILLRTGVVRSTLARPDRGLRSVAALRRWGTSPAGAFVGTAVRSPGALALIDERGSLTYADIERQTNALARTLAARGVREGDVIAVMARNHRGFVSASLAIAKLGADVLYLNTMFAGPQIREVCEREQVSLVIHDDEFGHLFDGLDSGVPRLCSWLADGADHTAVESLIAAPGTSTADLQPPSRVGRQVILTSGTTGTPKGAQRPTPRSVAPIAAFLEVVPYRAGDRWLLAAPIFHTWGFFNSVLCTSLGGTAVLPRRFDPEGTLQWIEQHRCQNLVVVPVMLQRIVDLGPEVIGRYDLSSLRVIAVSGSAFPGDLAVRVQEVFGDVVYNLYGSTEVAIATIATPEALRVAPGTAGRPTRWTDLKIVDDEGKPVPAGEVGRIFVGNQLAFEGYTGGGGKERLGGLLSSGDVGHLDEQGLLFVDGRDDDMIITGGENVFPREIEDLLINHDAVADAAVIGVPDDRWGQSLRAFVVLRPGEGLSAPELQRYVKAHLASYKVPREILFLDELPRNATGKVLKRELVARTEVAQ